MKIAFVFEIFFPEINGVMTATFNLVENLRLLGHAIYYVVPKTGKYKDKKTKEGIEVYRVPSLPSHLYEGIRWTWLWSRRLRCKLKRSKTDLVHLTAPSFLAIATAREAVKLGIPVVQTYHTLISEPRYYQYFFFSQNFPFAENIVWAYLNYLNKKCDVITAPSRYVINQFREKSPIKPVHYISNGIDTEVFKTHNDLKTLKTEYPQYNNKSFVFIGRLGIEKSIEILIRAMSLVGEKDREVRLFIIGQGPYGETLQKLSLDLGVDDIVFFLGKIDNKVLIKKGFLQHARAFLTASKTENQPMTILEAIAAGCPLILPREKGVSELMEDNGLFFEPDNTRELAEAILRLSADDELFNTCRARSLSLREKYNGRNVAAQFLKKYIGLIKKKI